MAEGRDRACSPARPTSTSTPRSRAHDLRVAPGRAQRRGRGWRATAAPGRAFGRGPLVGRGGLGARGLEIGPGDARRRPRVARRPRRPRRRTRWRDGSGSGPAAPAPRSRAATPVPRPRCPTPRAGVPRARRRRAHRRSPGASRSAARTEVHRELDLGAGVVEPARVLRVLEVAARAPDRDARPVASTST